jgi:hypothetical protein
MEVIAYIQLTMRTNALVCFFQFLEEYFSISYCEFTGQTEMSFLLIFLTVLYSPFDGNNY